MRRFIGITLTMLLAASMVSWAGGTPERGAAAVDNSIVVVSGVIPTLNPFGGHKDTGYVTDNIFASLTRFDSNNNIVPYLAESWVVSNQGRTYTFNLRRNAFFHDGTPITAEDVIFSIELTLVHNRFGQAMFGPIERMETPDDHTLVIHLSHPHPALLISAAQARTFPILPKHVYGNFDGEFSNHPAHEAPVVGSGPFVFKEWVPDEYLILERNPNHFIPDRPLLDKITFRVVTDMTAMRAGFRRNDFHLASAAVRFRDLDTFAAEPNLTVTRMDSPNGGGGYLEFNNRREPLNDRRVRQAIGHAIDRDYLADVLNAGYTRASRGPFPYTNLFFHEGLQGRGLDLERANRLLDEAGFPRQGANGIRFELGVLYIAPPYNPDRQVVVAEFIEQELAKVGIRVIQQPMEGAAAWSRRMADWDYDMSLILAGDRVDPAVGIGRLYVTDNIRNQAYTNTSGFSNPRVDELFMRGAREPDSERRMAIYSEVQELLVEEMPMVWLVDAVDHMIHVENLFFPTWGHSTHLDEVEWN